MLKISIRIKTPTDKKNTFTLNGFLFEPKDDGYSYTSIFPRQFDYVNRIIKDVEKADYKKPRKKRVLAPKVEAE